MQILFDLGMSKVSMNTAAVRNPDFIKASSNKFGNNGLVIAIDGRENLGGTGLTRLES